jgi:hypothetical protein
MVFNATFNIFWRVYLYHKFDVKKKICEFISGPYIQNSDKFTFLIHVYEMTVLNNDGYQFLQY